MTEHYRCRHGLTLGENCDACEIEAARETDRRYGLAVDEARKLIAAAPINQCDGCQIDAPLSPRGNHQMPDGGFMGCTKDGYVETFVREGRAQVQR